MTNYLGTIQIYNGPKKGTFNLIVKFHGSPTVMWSHLRLFAVSHGHMSMIYDFTAVNQHLLSVSSKNMLIVDNRFA